MYNIYILVPCKIIGFDDLIMEMTTHQEGRAREKYF